MRRIYIIAIIASLAVFAGCREPYEPDIASSNNSLLVVEGLLNAGTGPTSFRLSRSYKLDDSARLRPELGAQLTVEGNDNSTFPLPSAGNGYYSSPQLNLQQNVEYRLRIRTANGREYLSDYVPVKQTPAIDSVGWNRDAEGVQIYANTSDPTNDTRYYRWEYEETWEIRSPYYSFYVWNGTEIVERDPSDNVSVCYKSSSSDQIIIGSSARLQEDVIYQAPITFVPQGDEKMVYRYSILVKQYALTKEAYSFFELMKRNTENIGTIFDPQPSEVWGNIHSVSDPTELVIGYVAASTIQEKRIFISADELPEWDFHMFCPEVRVVNNRDSILDVTPHLYIPYDVELSPGGSIIAYYMSFPQCVDCRERQATLTKPSFW